MLEIEVASPVVTWLKGSGWDVYQEVETARGRCDIVAVKNDELWAVEVKKEICARVIRQALSWIGECDYVSIAVGGAIRDDWYAVLRALNKADGLGALQVRRGFGTDALGVTETFVATRRAMIKRYLFSCLHDEQKHFSKAGNADNRYFTKFKRTSARVVKAIEDRGELSIKDLVQSIDHHYLNDKTARAAIVHAIRKGFIPGLQVVRKNGRVSITRREMSGVPAPEVF